MKKRIALAIALILALATVFALASCGGNDSGCTNHTYSSDYTTDANGHWYESTCGCAGEVANYGAHKDVDQNGKCDVCEYVLCAHTFADTWSSDENTHYYASTCSCAPQKKDEATHVDADKNGVCDVCTYVVCSHEYQNEWSSDETNHWKAPVCGCEIDAIELGAHVDANKDGNCDTCAYVMCAHEYEAEWSSDGAYHWHAATCGCDVVKDKAEHNGDEDDSACPTCGASICNHTYADTLTYDDTYHWYASTCGCDIVKDKAEHTWSSTWEKDGINHWLVTECGCNVVSGTEEHFDSEDDDARCDKCGQIDFANLIGNVDEYIGEERNEISSESYEEDPIYEYNYSTGISVKVYDNYVLVQDNYGNKKYISYCGQYNDIPFVVNVDSENYVQREIDFDDSSLLSFSGVCDIATGTSLEEYLIALYTLAVSEKASGFNYTCDEANSKYSFSFTYDADWMYAYAVVEFTLDETVMGVTSLTLNEERYEYDSYVPGGNNTVAYIVRQTITQGFGEKQSSENEPNPYPASKYMLSELVLHKDSAQGELITNGCTVTIAPEYANGLHLYIDEMYAEYAEFNRYTIESEGLTAGWSNYPIFMYATKGGVYDVTISNELTSVSFTVVVEYKAPSKINTAVVIDDEKTKTKEYETYEGLDFVLGVVTNSAAESPFTNTPVVTSGDASKVSFVKDGENWRVVASAAGEYEITLTSALDASVSATLKLNVKAAPTVAEILNGYYEITENGDSAIGSIKFIPSESGATNGTANFKFTLPGNPMLGEEDEVYEAVLAYSYANGEITFTVTDGDEIADFKLAISDRYELMLIRTPFPAMPDYTIEYTYAPAKEVIIRDPTEGPSFTLNVTDTYVYSENDEFIFVAGEAGKYVFNVPTGYGLKVNANEKINYHNNTNGYEFTLELNEREHLIFIPMAAARGEFDVYFHIEKENKVTDANGLGGVYEFTFVFRFELTFTPDYHGASSGTLKVNDPANAKNSGTFRYTIVDGDYVFGEDTGIFITQDMGGNWLFQNSTLQKGQQFSGPTSFVELAANQIYYNGYTDENLLGGVYTVTVDGKEYKITIVPSKDGGASGKVQIYCSTTGEYSEICEYEIIEGDYFFDKNTIDINRDTNGDWLVSSKDINGVKFANATVVPQPQNLVNGNNTIIITSKDISRGGKIFAFTPTSDGKYTFSGSNLSVTVMYEGAEINTSEVGLDKGKTYTVVISANDANTYNLLVAKSSGSGVTEDDGTIVLPEEEA